ncbi:MAG: hypothetical protein FJ125_01360 [Deltaproteobacteria bacterium]|nr:hypothetical protein [Deltaproteobacteria bacterium]
MSAAKATAFATGAADPWCPGCGHTPAVKALQEALAERHAPGDVVLVTDIGCIGMADGLFTCHTVHGLHGRSPALGAGIAMSLPRPEMKVVVLMGDGGAAIGLQHLFECARLNVGLTLVVCNNQNYGMTGGQHSAYTVRGVKTTTTPEGMAQAPFALCEMLAPLGVMRARVLATSRELAAAIGAALDHPGFSLVETMNYCPSYSGKLNPAELTPRAMEAFFVAAGLSFGSWPATTTAAPYRFTASPKSSFPEQLPVTHRSVLAGSVRILLAGSAGEGVQNAAEVFAQAGIRSGLEAVVRGEYPVTVGKGFSASFLLLSAQPILSPAGERWDVALVTSGDGLRYVRERYGGSIRSLVLDASLPAGDAPALAGSGTAPLQQVDFRRHGARSASFAALAWLLEQERWFPQEALRDAVAALPSPKARESLLAVLEG